MTEHTQRPNHRQAPPWEREADSEPASFGAWLRRQREMREITLREISDATKISLRYLEALEQERFDLLPAKVFARGFLRQYARYVGLDPDEAVNRLLVAEDGEDGEDEAGERSEPGGDRWKPVKPSSGTWKNVILVVGLAALLLGLVFLVPWLIERLGSEERPEEPPPGVALSEAAEEPPAPTAPEVPAAPLEVTLDFRQNCWVEASVDGEPRVAEMRVQGESLQLQAQERVTLRLGNAGAVEVEVNGRPYDLGAQPGEVRTVEIDLDDLPAAGALPASGDLPAEGVLPPAGAAAQGP